MNTTFQVWLKRDGCSPEFEYFCMAETPNQAFMMGATDPHHIDWINLESKPYLVISEFRNNLHIIWHWRNNQWVIERSLQLPNEVIPVNLEAIEKWVKIIGDGSNWVTDKYIVNLCDNLTNYEKYLLLCHLANMGFLYDGDKEYTDEEVGLGEDIQKSKKATIGEIREWNGKKVKKIAEGKWVEVSEHGMTKKEHGGELYDLGYRQRVTPSYQKEYSKHHEAYHKLSDKEYTDEEIEGREDIQKGKKASIGETRVWNGKKFKKQSNGKWVEISSDNRDLSKKEHLAEAGKAKKRGLNIAYSKYHEDMASKLSDKEYSYISTKEKPPAGSILGINNIIHEERFKYLKEKSNG